MRCAPMRFAPFLFCLGLLTALAPFACSSTPSTTITVVRPELVAVDPADFMGNVPCGAPLPDPSSVGAGGASPEPPPRDPNAAHSYIATLFDVTPGIDGGVPNPGEVPSPGVPLASSRPTSCQQKATFSFVVANHRYLAQIDAYHEDPTELFPISPGSRLVNDANQVRVLPGWPTVVCGGYPPSQYDAGTDAGAQAGAGGAADDVGGGTGTGGYPPGVVSYTTITQTPHDCGQGLIQSDPKHE